MHGLNLGGLVHNTKDFDIPISYAVTFRYPNNQTQKGWNGSIYVNLPQFSPKSQIDGFRCGDVIGHKVPGFNATRSTEQNVKSFDDNNHLSWPSYGLLSGRDRYIYAKSIGKNSFLCSFGAGRTFHIQFLSSSAAPNANRFFTFRVTPFGRFGIPDTFQDINYDSQRRDYQGATSSDILTTNIFANLRGTERWRIEDVSSTGQKVLISAYYAGTGGLSFEDDGLNDATSSPVVWIEFTFSNAVADTVTITHAVKRNFAQAAGDGVNIMSTVAYTADGVGPNTTHKHAGQMKISYYKTSKNNPKGPNDTTNISTSWRVLDYAQNGSFSVQQEGYPNLYGNQTFTLIPKPGYWSGSLQEGSSLIRVVHLSYGANDSIVTVKSKYETTRTNITETISASMTGSITARQYITGNPPPNDLAAEGSGQMTAVVVKETYSLTKTSYAMLVNDVEVAVMSTEIRSNRVQRTNTYTDKWIPVGNGGGNEITSVDSNENKDVVSITTPELPNVGQVTASIGMGLSNMNSKLTTSYFRGNNIPLEEPGGKIWPFIRIESNKLVSFNIARAGYSMGVDSQGGGLNGQFAITYPVLAVGNHFWRIVYNLYTVAPLQNTEPDYGKGPNPMTNISGQACYCSYQPYTMQGLNSSDNPGVYV